MAADGPACSMQCALCHPATCHMHYTATSSLQSVMPVCCWGCLLPAGQPTPYLHLARAFEAMETTKKRLRISGAAPCGLLAHPILIGQLQVPAVAAVASLGRAQVLACVGVPHHTCCRVPPMCPTAKQRLLTSPAP